MRKDSLGRRKGKDGVNTGRKKDVGGGEKTIREREN